MERIHANGALCIEQRVILAFDITSGHLHEVIEFLWKKNRRNEESGTQVALSKQDAKLSASQGWVGFIFIWI